MTDKVKTLAPAIWKEIQKAKKILLHCHPSPDGDSIGSALACKHALEGIGKQVTIIAGDSELPKNLSFLPGFSQIEPKGYLDIDPKQFDLFLILDSSAPNQITKKGGVIFPDSLMTIAIDHHTSNTPFAKINLVDPTYPAVTQLLYDLFKSWEITITPAIAICLFTGIYTDTGFRYDRTTWETFAAAAELTKIYPEFTRTVFQIENNESPQQLAFLALSLSHIEHYFSGKVAISAVTYEEMAANNIERKHTEKSDIANLLKSVIGWEIGIRFTEVSPGVVTISFRTRDPRKWDLAKIAVATGFGGGHPAAAGANITKPFNEAKKLLLDTITKTYPELGKP